MAGYLSIEQHVRPGLTNYVEQKRWPPAALCDVSSEHWRLVLNSHTVPHFFITFFFKLPLNYQTALISSRAYVGL